MLLLLLLLLLDVFTRAGLQQGTTPTMHIILGVLGVVDTGASLTFVLRPGNGLAAIRELGLLMK